MTNHTAVMQDLYRIVVEHVEGGSQRFGWFASEAEAEDFAMRQRTKLGLDGCVSWYIEHGDA